MNKAKKAGFIAIMGGLLITVAITGNININHKKKVDEKLLAATIPTLPEASIDKGTRLVYSDNERYLALENCDAGATQCELISNSVSPNSMTYAEAEAYIKTKTSPSWGKVGLPSQRVTPDAIVGLGDVKDISKDGIIPDATYWLGLRESAERDVPYSPIYVGVGDGKVKYQRASNGYFGRNEAGQCDDLRLEYQPGEDTKDNFTMPHEEYDEWKAPVRHRAQASWKILQYSELSTAKVEAGSSVQAKSYLWDFSPGGCYTFRSVSEAQAYRTTGRLPENSADYEKLDIGDPAQKVDEACTPRTIAGVNAAWSTARPLGTTDTYLGVAIGGRADYTHRAVERLVDQLRAEGVADMSALGFGYTREMPDEGFTQYAACGDPNAISSTLYRMEVHETYPLPAACAYDGSTGKSPRLYVGLEDGASLSDVAAATKRHFDCHENEPILGGKHRVRPTLTADLSSIAYFDDVNPYSLPETSKAFTKVPGTHATTEDGYTRKVTYKDAQQKVTGISRGDSTEVSTEIDEETRVVKVATDTTLIKFNVKAEGLSDADQNYVTALGIDKKDSNKIKIGRIAKVNSENAEVELSISQLVGDEPAIGTTAKVALYTEGINLGERSNTIAEEPYVFEIMVVKEQKIDFDDATKTKLASPQYYGESIEIGAYIRSTTWDTTTPMEFSLEGTDASNYAIISNQNWNSSTGKLTATLTYLLGGARDLKLKVTKAGTDTYARAEEISSNINLLRRQISVSVELSKYYWFVGDFFDFSKDVKIVARSKISGIKEPMVSGDILPYRVGVSKRGLEGITELPITDGILDVEAIGSWNLYIEGDIAPIKDFESKYAVELRHSLTVPSIGLIVRPLDFRAIVNENFTKQLQSKTVYDGEPVELTAEVMYPITKNDTGTVALTAEEQQLSYKIQRKVYGGTDYQDITGGVFNPQDNLGILSIQYSMDAVSSADHMSAYRILVWNQKNKNNSASDKAEDYAAISQEAVIQVTTNPTTLVNVPSAIEVSAFGDVIKDAEISDTGEIKEADTRINLEYTNAAPAGDFKITTNPEVSLSLESKKAYTLDVLKADGNKLASSSDLLMVLNKDLKSQSFSLRGKVSDFKEIGSYKGIMIFTINYDGGTPAP